MSLYSFSQDQRIDSSSNAFAGAITATIIGLIIGIAITVVGIIIGVVIMVRGQVASGSSGDLPGKKA